MHIVAITIIGILAVCVVALLIVNDKLSELLDEVLSNWHDSLNMCEELISKLEKLLEIKENEQDAED